MICDWMTLVFCNMICDWMSLVLRNEPRKIIPKKLILDRKCLKIPKGV
jgi:hypothetical protein